MTPALPNRVPLATPCNTPLRSFVGNALARISILLVFYTLVRIVFFLANRDLFPLMDPSEFATILLGGIRFDLAGIFYTNLAFLIAVLIPLRCLYHPVYQKVCGALFLASNFVALAMNCADIGYFPFTRTRTTIAFFSEFSNETEFTSLIMQLAISHWHITVLWLSLCIVLYALHRKLGLPQATLQPSSPWRYYIREITWFLVATYLVVSGIRGAFISRDSRPMTSNAAANYVEHESHIPIVLNTPFTVIRHIRKRPLPNLRYFSSPKALASLYSVEYRPTFTQPHEPLNVVILIVESMSHGRTGYYTQHLRGDKPSRTPFLDSLIPKSYSFDNAFANGLKSIDALPSIVASIPSLVHPYVTGHHANNRINGLGTLLAKRGYDTSFFHGAVNGSMGFQSFVKLAGFENYFGRTEYEDAYPSRDDYDGDWGIWDEEFLEYSLSEINGFQQPFLATIFTLSSHSPFKIPPRYDKAFSHIKSAGGKTTAYTDYALKRFFETASGEEWYSNTLFVITADHASWTRYPEFMNQIGIFKIPLLFFAPGNPSLVGHDYRVAQQLDILPTLMGYLKIDDPFVAFGSDLFQPGGDDTFALNHIDHGFQLVMGEHLLRHSGERVLGFFNYREDPLLKTNLADASNIEQHKKLTMTNRLKAMIQAYTERMRENRLSLQDSPTNSAPPLEKQEIP